MTVERLALADYRNLESATLVFSPGFSVLVGRNGAGKTNIIEALYLLSTLRSFRISSLGPLVRRERPRARVELTLRDPDEPLPVQLLVALESGPTSTRRTASVNGKTVRAAETFYGRLPAILFTPEDLNVLRGSPAGRRQLLDRMLFARVRTHIGDVRDYDKLVRSRNRVLKDRRQGDAATAMLDTYDEQLATLGARIWSRRVAVLDELRPDVIAAFAEIHGPADCRLEYASRFGDVAPDDRARQLANALLERREHDTMRGTTTVGPHHDDFHAVLEGRPVAEYASQGQTRAIMLALKIAELRSARALLGRSPLLLLDDVSSELDPQRSARLFALLAGEVEQCVVTTTDDAFLPIAAGSDRVDYRLVDGRVSSPA